MSDNEPKPLPTWLKAAASVFIGFHFLVLGAHVLSSRSGPWPSPFGQSTAEGPPFATSIVEATFPWYLDNLRFTHDYHFMSNHVSQPEVKFEIKLYNKLGQVIDTLEFPEKSSNPWVKHRLDLLAQNLSGDVPVEARFSENTPPPGVEPKYVEIWSPTGKTFAIEKVAEHLVPRNRPVFRPSPWATLVAKSYVRYQCRLHSAAEGELIRHSRDAVQPSLVLVARSGDPKTKANLLNEANFQEMVASFGKVKP